MTLTDFLLVRIAEDESRAGEHHHLICFAPGVICNCAYPARVLAECEAKRRIVSHCDLLIRGPEFGHFTESDGDSGRTILRALALPYADHPDYREEWRP